MSDSVLDPREKVRCLITLIGALAVVATSSSLTWPILAEALRNRGFGETMIGLNAASQFAGIVAVALAATWIMPRLGFFRTVLAGLLTVAVMLALLPALRDYWVWFVVRFLLGAGNALLFTAGDTWINQILEDKSRGRWLGIYSTVGMAGWAVGPLLGSVLDPESWWPFLIGIITVVAAIALLLQTRRIDVRLTADEPAPPGGHLVAVFLAAPTVLLASAMFGVVEGGVQSFAHLYSMDLLGEQYRSIGYAVIWVASVGAVFFQYPIGWLADRLDRGWLLVTCVTILACMIALFPFLIDNAVRPWWSPGTLALWAVVSVWGGMMGAVYTVGITLLGVRFRAVELVAANAVFSLLFGIGGLVGPFLVGAAMGHLGPQGFPDTLVAVVAAYALFAAWRQVTRRRRLPRRA